MFGLSAIIVSAVNNAIAYNEWFNSLTDEQKQKEIELQKENLSHKRALEIANISRPRNFWGQ